LVDTIYSFTLSSAIPNSIWLPLPADNNTIFPLVKLNSFEHTPLIYGFKGNSCFAVNSIFTL
jgi:hypothetical protein